MRKPVKARRREAELRRRMIASIVMRRMWRRGKRGTRREMMPRKRVTVWAGTSWEKATRKEIWRAMVPLMEVRLLEVSLQSVGREKGSLRPLHIPREGIEEDENQKGESIRDQSGN